MSDTFEELGSGCVRENAAREPALRVLAWQRRADVLRQPPLPCLSKYHTLNLTAGCPNECRYCYAQNYKHHPGWGTVAFYANTLERLRAEFEEVRPRPTLVYLSTASEPFLPVERIQDDMFEIMRFLLEKGVFLLISTKGVIGARFADLFAQWPGRVLVQVGLTTVDDETRRLLEPRATSVAQRLANVELLAGRGVPVEARMDPSCRG